MTVPPVTRRVPYRLFYRNFMSRLFFSGSTRKTYTCKGMVRRARPWPASRDRPCRRSPATERVRSMPKATPDAGIVGLTASFRDRCRRARLDGHHRRLARLRRAGSTRLPPIRINIRGCIKAILVKSNFCCYRQPAGGRFGRIGARWRAAYPRSVGFCTAASVALSD